MPARGCHPAFRGEYVHTMPKTRYRPGAGERQETKADGERFAGLTIRANTNRSEKILMMQRAGLSLGQFSDGVPEPGTILLASKRIAL